MTSPVRLLLTFVLLVAPPVRAQGDYYNLDAGRPLRVEDASATARHELEIQIAPLRYEKGASGVRRWRLEPKIAWGVAPFTELEVRVPFLVVDSPDSATATRAGSGGVAIGAMHAFGVERGPWPVLALGGEWLAPTGELSASVGSYLVKAMATRTFDQMRTHVNVGYGTYSTRLNVCAQPRPINIPAPEGCPPGPIPFDPPCSLVPEVSALCAAGALGRREDETFDVTRSVGMRWLAALGVDWVFPLQSTLVTADVVAERFAGLFRSTDVSAEVGVRHQLTPLFVVDLGVTRHFNGLLRSNSVSVAFGYGVSLAGARQ